MKLLTGDPFDGWRVTAGPIVDYYGGAGDEVCGAFRVPRRGIILRVIASAGGGWDHVSVSTPKRCPTWGEMSFIKHAFFAEDEWAMELHPPKSEHINCHPYTLHLWRPHGRSIPLPPAEYVGPKAVVMP